MSESDQSRDTPEHSEASGLTRRVIEQWRQECADDRRHRSMIFADEWRELCDLACKALTDAAPQPSIAKNDSGLSQESLGRGDAAAAASFALSEKVASVETPDSELARHLGAEHIAMLATMIDSPMNACSCKEACQQIKSLLLSRHSEAMQALDNTDEALEHLHTLAEIVIDWCEEEAVGIHASAAVWSMRASKLKQQIDRDDAIDKESLNG